MGKPKEHREEYIGQVDLISLNDTNSPENLRKPEFPNVSHTPPIKKHVLMHTDQQTIHAIYIHVCNQDMYQGKSILHTKLKGRICKYILASFLHISQ